MSLWYVLYAIIALGAALALIRVLERRAERRQPDPHQETHGDVMKPPSSWRGNGSH